MRALTASVFVGAAIVLSLRLAAPFETDLEEGLAQYGLYARNYVKHGMAVSGGAPLNLAGPLEAYPSLREQIYSHRPPVVSLLMGAAAAVFGLHEAVLRGVCVAASLLALCLFRAVGARLVGPGQALIATALLAALPIFSYYAVAVVHPVFGLVGALSIYLLYLRWREKPDGTRLAFLLAGTFFACFLDWPAFFGAGAVGLLHAVAGGRPRWIATSVWGCAVGAFGTFLGYLYLLDPEHMRPLKMLLLSGAGHGEPIPILEYLKTEAREVGVHFTVAGVVTAALGLPGLSPRRDFRHAALLSLAFLGADEVLFMNMCWWHSYLTFPLGPVVALLAVRGLQRLSVSPAGRAVAAVLLTGLVLQSAYVLHRRTTFVGRNEVTRELGRALQRHTAPGERSLVRVNHDVHLRSWYADRAVVTYAEPTRRLQTHYVNPSEEGVDDDVLIRRLSGKERPYHWFVTSTAALAAGRLDWIRRLAGDDAFLRRYFWIEAGPGETPLLAFLRSRFPVHERDGFLFADLR